MSETTEWTIGRLLEWTADYLKQHGSETPRLDAEVLLARVRQCERIMLYTAFAEPASEEVRTEYRSLVKRRAEGAPVAYLVGYREFYSLDFDVSPAVLIPRPETEFLVIGTLDLIQEQGQKDKPLRIIDVGTGSGIVAICLAKNLPHAEITAVDVSPDALAIAQQNARKHDVADRITFLESDVFANVPSGMFDYVVSNPPYIPIGELPDIQKDVREFEPHVALFSGDDGCDVIRRLISESTERLEPNGFLLFEISDELNHPVQKLIDAAPNLKYQKTIKDLAGHARTVVAKRG
ncbi:MAG: peptide chain release factor N(5)-glutamine methyltransferase [Pirellulaceae bacterium]